VAEEKPTMPRFGADEVGLRRSERWNGKARREKLEL